MNKSKKLLAIIFYCLIGHFLNVTIAQAQSTIPTPTIANRVIQTEPNIPEIKKYF